MKYRRVLLKLSGEQFGGGRGHGIDSDFLNNVAKELKDVAKTTGSQIAVVVGGGNIVRGKDLHIKGLETATGHYMGMLAGILNGMALVDVLEAAGQPARLQTRLRMESVAEPYIRRRALRHMEKGRIVVIAGGTGNPYFSHDTAAVITALDLGCDAVLKATKVDGVYDKDPMRHKGAKKHDFLSHTQALQDPDINVMDNSAISFALDHRLPIIVFSLLPRGNIKKVIQGKKIGTKVSHQK